MQFPVPQFIEEEPKIVGPLTFRQFLFIGIASAICFFLYFSIGKTNFFLFLSLSIFIMGIGAALAFLKISGRNLPIVIVNFFRFSLGAKIYIWKKKETPITVFKKPVAVFKKEEELPLKIVEGGQLTKIRNKIEIKTK